LIIRSGDPTDVISEFIEKTGANSLYFNRRYDPEGIREQQKVRKHLASRGISVHEFNAALLFEPDLVKTHKGSPYRVFTPFWNACLALPAPSPPVPAPDFLAGPKRWPSCENLKQLYLQSDPHFSDHLKAHWTPGAESANRALERFLSEGVANYITERDRPDHAGTSSLSPHLRFGEISPRQVWHSVLNRQAREKSTGFADNALAFLRQLGWREFSHHLLYHFPTTPTEPLRSEFAKFPWRNEKKLFVKWKAGNTGYPIVDAGMRQLLSTGWMHNRARMIVASFLVKDLLIPWQLGAQWFWEQLVDADLANNTLGWQWVAGCGADAAPFFRIFNPRLQGEKFDPEGSYVRLWIPELKRLRDRWIHHPWEAPESVLREANVALGRSYPIPVVDHSTARKKALTAYEQLKSSPRV
jgi:deoxyribodipyrimidine photo-lyase